MLKENEKMGNLIIDSLILDDDVRETIQGWNIHLANGYPRISLKGRYIYLHHYVCPTPKGMVTDHINRNVLDCRRENLRVVTNSENLRNSPPRYGREHKYIYKTRSGWEIKTPDYYKHFRDYDEMMKEYKILMSF